MTLKEILKKNHFVEGSSAERLIDIVKEQIGEDAVFEEDPNKLQYGLSFASNDDLKKTKITNSGITIEYKFKEINVLSTQFNCIFEIEIHLSNMERIIILCTDFFLAKGTKPNYKEFTICVVRFKDGVRDDLCYWPVDENGGIRVTYDYRGGDQLAIVTLDDVLKAIEEENWKQILLCDFAKKHIKARTREEIQITDK